MPVPNRGEVWIVDLGMAGKVRPSVVLSLPAGPQDRALVTLVAHTTSARGSSFEVAVRSRLIGPRATSGCRAVPARIRAVSSTARSRSRT